MFHLRDFSLIHLLSKIDSVQVVVLLEEVPPLNNELFKIKNIVKFFDLKYSNYPKPDPESTANSKNLNKIMFIHVKISVI